MNHDELLRHIATAEKSTLKSGDAKKALVMSLLNLQTEEEQETVSAVVDAIVWAANNRHLIGGVVGGTSKCCSSLMCHRKPQ
jgi:hypothetical protein